jgi:nucleotide-binding universal stress UspA family protein
MFETILWATDASETAARALPFAVELAKSNHANLVVAHARELFVAFAGGYPVLADEDDLRRRFAGEVEELQRDGLAVEFVVRNCASGHAARAIAAVAEEVGADLIVVGTHGYGRLGGALLGSVTNALLRAGVCPVLAVPTCATAERPAAAPYALNAP